MSKKNVLFVAISVALMLSLLGGALFGQGVQKNSLYRYLSIFTEVFSLVRSNYVEDVPADQLIDGAFAGVTDAIDEFSYYVPPAQMARYRNFVEGDDNGFGLVVTRRFGYAYVLSAIDGSPADRAGIARGDFVEKVNGQPTQKMAVWQVREALRTDKPVELTVLRGGLTKRDNFRIVPEAQHPRLKTQQFDDVAYIKIPYFDKGMSAQFREALDQARKAGRRKLIVDLRGNAGGEIEEAIKSADELLSGGIITSLEGRRVDRTRWTADRATDYDGEVELLIDNATAGGAEVMAAAIHGNHRGKLVGVPTYGKSIVQRFVPLQSGGGVYMTVAHYATQDSKSEQTAQADAPAGQAAPMKAIKEQGVRPDVLVDLTSEVLRDPNNPGARPREDLILNRALALFKEPAVAEKKAA
jgi:carboxyl-terminal processing protease